MIELKPIQQKTAQQRLVERTASYNRKIRIYEAAIVRLTNEPDGAFVHPEMFGTRRQQIASAIRNIKALKNMRRRDVKKRMAKMELAA